MIVYIVKIDNREHDGEIFGVYTSKARAIKGVQYFVYTRYGSRAIKDLMEAYGGNPDEGHFACEERNIYIVEKPLKGDNDIDGDIA